MLDNINFDNKGLFSTSTAATAHQANAYNAIFNAMRESNCSIWDFKLIYEEIVKYMITTNKISST